MIPAQQIAQVVEETIDVHQVVPYRPPRLAANMAFIEPASPWKQRDEDASFCSYSAGLVIWLVAGSTDPVQSVDWLDEQSSLLMAAEFRLAADLITVAEVGPPVLLVQDAPNTATFYACRLELTRFILEAE